MTTSPPMDSPERRAALDARRGKAAGVHISETPTPPPIFDDVDTTPPQPDPAVIALEMKALANMLGKIRLGENGGEPAKVSSWFDGKVNLPTIITVLGIGAAMLMRVDGIDARTTANTAAILDLVHGREVNLPLLQAEIRRGDTQDFRLGAQSQALDRIGVQVDAMGRRVDGLSDRVSDLDKRQAVLAGQVPSPGRDR